MLPDPVDLDGIADSFQGFYESIVKVLCLPGQKRYQPWNQKGNQGGSKEPLRSWLEAQHTIYSGLF